MIEFTGETGVKSTQKRAMAKAYLSDAYTMAEIAGFFGGALHDSQSRSAEVRRRLADNLALNFKRQLFYYSHSMVAGGLPEMS